MKIIQKVIQRKYMQENDRTELFFGEFVRRVTNEVNKLINNNDIEIKSISYPDLYTAVIVLISYEE